MLSKVVRNVYNLFELLDLMEQKGYMSKYRYLDEMVKPSYNFANDIYLDMFFGEGTDEEFNIYHDVVRRILDIENDDTVLMEVCW